MKTAIIIPSYNESQNIGKLVEKIIKVEPTAEIVVVDDNSPDGTPLILEKLARMHQKVHVIIRKNERGRGSAVIKGLAYASKNLHPDLFVEMDADFSHEPTELPRLIAAAQPQTVVIGSRYVKGAKIVNWPLVRVIGSHLANGLIKLVLGLPISDNTNGYRVYPPAAVDYLLGHKFISKGYINLSEIAYLLRKRGFSFTEVPTVFVNRVAGKSNATFKEFFASIINLFRIRMQVK